MKNLETLARRNLSAILLALLLGGFVVLLAELLITNHVDGIQNVAVIASGIGAAAILAGFFVKGVARHMVVLLLLVLTLSGLLGAWEHFEEGRSARSGAALAAADSRSYQTIAAHAGPAARTPQQAEERRGSDAPPLAPLSLSGLALMGAVVLLAKQDAQTGEG